MVVIRNVSNQVVRKISEGLCDTEHWSNDAENSAITGINYNLLYIQVENNYILNVNISQYDCFFCCCCFFYQINAALMDIRDL